MDIFNILISHYMTFLLFFLINILMTICGRKSRRPPVKPSIHEPQQPASDPNYDETQENIQTVDVQEDPLANVRLLTPTLPGGCTDENAAKEAATRHKTNQYFPKLQLQSRRIVNRTSKEELKSMVDALPPHPPQRYRTEIREPAVDKRKEKWKNAHVHWSDTGLVFVIRSHDPCRSKDDGGGDTIDSPSKEDQESTKINSEMPMSDKKEKSKQKTPRKSKEKTPAPLPQSSKRGSQKERKLAPTQEETAKSDNRTPNQATPRTPGIPSTPSSGGITTGPESLKSVNL
ncbi:hypothetical protein B9Z55_010075 [Caenorhabditis nigoni]|uniref:Uncharacterized protein n=1 Tax=Caenorhabditis nigoni TaxID=1611254 RepID=A0A2G5UED7_9PELO|nr:hypothetical protein B9Z55_010075 [Caenorhabditis nigoni]